MRYQGLGLRGGQLKHEVAGETVRIPPDLLSQPDRFDAVESGQLGVQHDSSSADGEDARLKMAEQAGQVPHNIHTSEGVF